jgi:hypothetical protein
MTYHTKKLLKSFLWFVICAFFFLLFLIYFFLAPGIGNTLLGAFFGVIWFVASVIFLHYAGAFDSGLFSYREEINLKTGQVKRSDADGIEM